MYSQEHMRQSSNSNMPNLMMGNGLIDVSSPNTRSPLTIQPSARRRSNADGISMPSASDAAMIQNNLRMRQSAGNPNGFMTPTVQGSFQFPLPSAGVSGGGGGGVDNSSKPLFQRCVDLIAQLYSFPLFEFYLFPDGVEAYVIPSLDGGVLPVISDPVDVLWNCFKLGAPLCVIYNELAKTTTGQFLNVDDVSGIRAPFYPTKPCKDNLYKFITQCRSELNMAHAQELSGVSELYKDDTSGFMKFLKLVEDLVHRIEVSGNMPEPKLLPFSTEISKEISNPVMKELVETERSYIFSLEELLRFQNEIIAMKLFSKDMLQSLFSNLSEVVDFQRRFMVGMESTLNLGLTEQRIGQLFILNEEAFEVYFPFCTNYSNASNFVLMRAEELKQFSHIIPPHNITAYLIKPLQRLLKYPLLLKELIKFTDPEAYPYMDELKEGLEAVKRVTERLNELRRKEENERLKQELVERLEDWKGLQIRDFGDLLLCEQFPIASNDQEREYHLFLFERILLCCKKDMKPAKRASSRKRSDAGKENQLFTYILRGNIYISSIVRVEDTSDAEIGAFSIRVFWKDVSEPETVCFALKCRNEEQVALWTDRLNKQVVTYQRRRKNSEFGTGPYQPMMGSRQSDYSGSTAYDQNPAMFIGGTPQMMRSMSNPNAPMYGMPSPVSPGGPYLPQRQVSFDQYGQPQYMMSGMNPVQSGLNSAMLSIPPQTGLNSTVMALPNSRGSQSQPGQYGYNRRSGESPVPPMPAMGGARGPNSMVYAVGPDGRPVPSRMDSINVNPPNLLPRKMSLKRNEGLPSASVSKSRQALDALASLASSGLPIAGFSDDEDDSPTTMGEEDPSMNRQMHSMQINARKQSTANGMMMGTSAYTGQEYNASANGRRPSTSNGGVPSSVLHNARTGSLDTGAMRSSPSPAGQLLPAGFQRKSSNMDRNSPQPYQFPPGSPGINGTIPGPPHYQQQQSSHRPTSNVSPRSPNPNSPSQSFSSQADLQQMRRTPTAPSSLSTSSAAVGGGSASSFIKIRTHYDGDVLIIAMPVRGATLQELRNRVERKVNMMPHKPMLSNPIRMTVKEESIGADGTKEWKLVRALETDEDVLMSFTTNAGFLNLFLA